MCLRTIAPKILTWGQYADAAMNLLQKTVMGRDLPEYVPDFTKCIDHFALHAGKASISGWCFTGYGGGGGEGGQTPTGWPHTAQSGCVLDLAGHACSCFLQDVLYAGGV